MKKRSGMLYLYSKNTFKNRLKNYVLGLLLLITPLIASANPTFSDFQWESSPDVWDNPFTLPVSNLNARYRIKVADPTGLRLGVSPMVLSTNTVALIHFDIDPPPVLYNTVQESSATLFNVPLLSNNPVHPSFGNYLNFIPAGNPRVDIQSVSPEFPLTFGRLGLSMMAWVQYHSLGAGEYTVIGIATTTFRIVETSTETYLAFGPFGSRSENIPALQDGQWHMVSMVIGMSTNVQYFFDGKLVQTRPSPFLPREFRGPITIGAQANISTATFSGYIDEVKIVDQLLDTNQNTQLTEEFMALEYNSGVVVAFSPAVGNGVLEMSPNVMTVSPIDATSAHIIVEQSQQFQFVSGLNEMEFFIQNQSGTHEPSGPQLINVSTNFVPGNIVDLTAWGEAQIGFRWTVPLGGPTTYYFYAQPLAQGPITAANVDSVSLVSTYEFPPLAGVRREASIKGLIPGATYYVAVRSLRQDSIGTSGFSPLATAGPFRAGSFHNRREVMAPQNLKNVVMKLADVDNDGRSNLRSGGRVDFAIMGENENAEAVVQIYRWNPGNKKYESVPGWTGGGNRGQLEWIDFDSDGDLDLYASNSSDRILLQNNLSLGIFEPNNSYASGVSNYFQGNYASVDIDNDGDSDLIGVGNFLNTSDERVQIIRNEGHSFAVDFSTSISSNKFDSGDVAIADFNGDGKKDILIVGELKAALLFNLGKNNFRKADWPGSSLKNAAVAVGDYDKDGDMDFVLTGLDGVGNPTSLVFKNNIAATPIQNINVLVHFEVIALSVGLHSGGDSSGREKPGSVAWGDVDNDNDLDLVIMGKDNATPTPRQRLLVYLNNGGRPDTWTYLEPLGTNLGLSQGTLALGDIDEDNSNDNFAGDLDIFVAGWDGNETRFYVLENLVIPDASAITLHPRPVAPGNLVEDVNLRTIKMGWDAPGGLNGLMYEVQVSTLQFSQNLSTFTLSGVTGSPFIGNHYGSQINFGSPKKGLEILVPDGSDYYWRVRSIDPSMAGGATVEGGVINVPELPPVLINDFKAVSGAQIHLSWTAPSGDPVVNEDIQSYGLYVHVGIPSLPIQITDLGVGNWVPREVTISTAPVGTKQELTITGLIPGQDYWFALVSTDKDMVSSTAPAVSSAPAGHFQATHYPVGESTGMARGQLAWGDLDNDNDLDFVVSGSSSNGGNTTDVYFYNSVTKNFDFKMSLGSDGNLFNPYISLADFDADGDLDLAVRGSPGGGQTTVIRLFKNTGDPSEIFDLDETQELITQAGLSPTDFDGSQFPISWVDYNQDGFPDLSVLGRTDEVTMFRNNNAQSFTAISIATGIGNKGRDLKWADMDQDGDIDLLVAAEQGVWFFEQIDGFKFIKHKILDQRVYGLALAVGDINLDGYWDLAMAGGFEGNLSPEKVEIKLIKGGPDFINTAPVSLSTAVYSGGISKLTMLAFADINSDGYPDLVASGQTGTSGLSGYRFLLFENQQNETFAIKEHPFGENGGLVDGSIAMGDYDGDKDADMLVMGRNRQPKDHLVIFENLKNPPSLTVPVPTGLTATVAPGTGQATLTWNAQPGFSYAVDIFEAGNPNRKFVTPVYGSPLMGNYLLNSTDTIVSTRFQLPVGTFQYRVSAVNPALIKSAPSTASPHFIVDAVPPNPIDDLEAEPGKQLRLKWTVTGADGNVGTPTGYNIYAATYAFVSPSDPFVTLQVLNQSKAAGVNQIHEATGLNPATTYYVQMEVLDGNEVSPLSNQVSAVSGHFGLDPYFSDDIEPFGGVFGGGLAVGKINGINPHLDMVMIGISEERPGPDVTKLQLLHSFPEGSHVDYFPQIVEDRKSVV